MDRYALKLEILTDAFKKSINEVKGIVHNFTSDIKKESKIELAEGLSAGHLIAEVSKAEEKIKQFNAEIAKRKQMGLDTSVAEGNVQRLNDFVNVANQRLNELGAKKVDLTGLNTGKKKVKDIGDEAENTKEKMSGISISATQTNNTIVNGFKDAWKSIKRFAFSLLSIRGIYGLVRKASSAYMAQDTQLSQQMQRTWASLGAMMAPIIEKIVHWIRVAAAYINYFVKALTGKDLIGKAVKKINSYNKAVGGTAKSAKALNKELTTLDEVTNLSFDDASTQGIEDVGAAFDDFSDIKLDPKITETLDKWAEAAKKLWDRLKPVRDILGKVVDWAINHPEAVLTILGGAALVNTLRKLTGTGGLGTFASLLKPLATIGVVTVGVELIYDAVTGRSLIGDIKEINEGIKELNGFISDNTKTRKENEKQGKSLNKMYNESITKSKKTNKQYQTEAKDLLNLVHITKEEIKIKNGQYTLTGQFTGANKKLSQQTKSLEKETYNYLKTLGKYYDTGVLTTEQTKAYKKALEEEIKYYKENYTTTYMNTEQTKKYKETLGTLEMQLKKVSNGKYVAKTDVDTTQSTTKANNLVSLLNTKVKDKLFKAKTDVDDKTAENKTKTLGTSLSNIAKTFTATFKIDVGTKDAKNKIKNFFTSTNNLFKKGSALGGIVKAMDNGVLNALINAIPGYDVGTPYVPNDQLAMVHKGEAIIPKKFNNEQFFNNNNEETNALLVEVNQNLIELRNRPNVFEVNGKELAQATYSDFQNEGSRLNQSMTIKKVGGN